MRRPRTELDDLELVRLAPAAGVVAVWAAQMFTSGGYRPGTWMPAGLVTLGLLALAVLGGGRSLPSAPGVRRPLLALLAFTAWCFASIAWSDAPGLAWEAANLLLVGVAGAWVLALTPWRARSAQALVIAFSIAAAAACLEGILAALAAADLTSAFEDFRYSPPLDYPNATAAFGFMAALPALLLAARPDASIPAKASAQGLATFLCAYALLPQSRGAILGGIAAVVVLAVVVPFRWRLALHALLLGVVVAFTAGPIGDVFVAAAETGRASDALGEALTAILLATAVGVAGGLALAYAEDRISLSDTQARAARLAGFAAGALAVLALAGAGAAQSSRLSETASNHWEALTHPGEEFANDDEGETSRLTRTDPSDRYDYWRVAVDGFASNPLGGMGAGGFEQRYALDRRSATPSRYPHNLFMKVLGDTGIVGIGLIGAFVGLAGAGLLRGTRRQRSRDRAVAATGLAVLAYFLAHGLFDWLEAYPVLVGPALGFPLVALAVCARAERRGRGGEDRPAAADPPAGRRDAAAWVAVTLIGVAAFASLLAPWFALRYRERAVDTWREAPAAAYADLDRAASLDPLGAQPLVLKGVIALTRGDLPTAEASFEDALDRQQAWLGHFGLAVVADQRADPGRVASELAAALRQHPEDEVLPGVAKAVRADGAVDPARALRDVLAAPHATIERVS